MGVVGELVLIFLSVTNSDKKSTTQLCLHLPHNHIGADCNLRLVRLAIACGIAGIHS